MQNRFDRLSLFVGPILYYELRMLIVLISHEVGYVWGSQKGQIDDSHNILPITNLQNSSPFHVPHLSHFDLYV